MNKLVYVGFAFPHHLGTSGGYHHIKEFLRYDYIVDCQTIFTQRELTSNALWARILRRINGVLFCGKPYIPWYLLKILWLSLFHKKIVFHVIYGENLIDKRFWNCVGKHEVVCTLHQPFSWFEKNKVWYSYLKRINKVILVAPDDIHSFEKLTGKNNVTYIPHGICSNFYCLPKGGQVTKDGSILMVGNWLRNFKFANLVFNQILKINPSQIINIVCNEKSWINFKDERIHCYAHLTDEELRNLYWKSSVMFLPLIRFTANNALLEASSCGCNIVIASTQIENSYVPNSLLNILPLDVEVCVKFLQSAVKGKTFNNNLSQYVISLYSWNEIAETTDKYLRSNIEENKTLSNNNCL